jgi:hypothetical protein
VICHGISGVDCHSMRNHRIGKCNNSFRSCYMPCPTHPFPSSFPDARFHASIILYATRLLVVILSLVVDDVEEAELVNTLGGGNDAEPVTKLLLLEELLGAKSNCQHFSLQNRRLAMRAEPSLCVCRTYRYFK